MLYKTSTTDDYRKYLAARGANINPGVATVHDNQSHVQPPSKETPKKATDLEKGHLDGTESMPAVPSPEKISPQVYEPAGSPRSCEGSIHPFGKTARIMAHLKWACQSASESTPEPKAALIEESGHDLSEIVSKQKSDDRAADAMEGWENIEDLSLDLQMFPRVQLNAEYVTHLQDRIEAGDRIPTITVTKPDLKVTSGAHRHKALKLISEKVRMGARRQLHLCTDDNYTCAC